MSKTLPACLTTGGDRSSQARGVQESSGPVVQQFGGRYVILGGHLDRVEVMMTQGRLNL